MARFKMSGLWQDGQGAVVASGTITVYLAGTTTLATAYNAETGAALTGSATTTNASGVFHFWIDDGDYAGTQKFRIIGTKTNFANLDNEQTDDLVILPVHSASASETFSNKKLKDSSVTFVDNGDITKQLAFQCSGITTGTTRTWNVPDSDDTLVGKDTTDVFTNKTNTNLVINGTVSGDAFLDEDAMGSNSATKVASQQSIKAYVDAQSSAGPEYRNGFNCKQASSTTITVEGGSINVAGTVVTKTADTTLTLTTATDWVDDTSDQAVSTYAYIYINAAGKIEMDNVAPDESDTSGNTTGILRYNDTGTDTSDRRMIGWFYMNATGAGELNSWEVGNLADAAQNSAVRTDTVQDTIDDTSYGSDLTNTEIRFYSSGKGRVQVSCHIWGDLHTANIRHEAIINDGSDITASGVSTNLGGTNGWHLTPNSCKAYSQGVITFSARAKVTSNSMRADNKTITVKEI